MVLYREKRFYQKLLEVINEFSKVARYTLEIQKLVAFLDTNNEVFRMINQENNLIYNCQKNKMGLTTWLARACIHAEVRDEQQLD